MMNSEHFLLEGFPLPTYSYPAQGQMTLLQDNSTTSRKCVCVCALFFPFPSGQLQRMAPKRFGIEFLLIHLLFLPGLPLLHQLFHHKMPQIQNRQRRIWWHHWLVIYPCGSSWTKHKTTNSQNLKQADSIEAYYHMLLFLQSSFRATSANIFKERSAPSNHTSLMRLWDACVGSAKGLSTAKTPPLTTELSSLFVVVPVTLYPLDVILQGEKNTSALL